MSDTHWHIKRWPVLMALTLLAGQAWFSQNHQRQWQANLSLGQAPGYQWTMFASLGERPAAARALSLYTQSYDAQAGKALSIRAFDFRSTTAWLALASDLAPTSAYPTFLASRIYAAVAPPDQTRRILDWVASRYRASPGTQWPWLAHAVFLAEHELNDAHLARQYANILRTEAGSTDVPQWARDLEVFLLQDLNEFEAAQTLLGGLIQSGQIRDQRALDVMIGDLERIRSRFQGDQRPQQPTGDADLVDDTIKKSYLVR